MNWLDNYIKNNEDGYLMNGAGGLFVSIDEEYVRHVKGDKQPVNLDVITKDLFLDKLVN